MVSRTLCPTVHILGSQNVYGRAEGIADHYRPWAVFLSESSSSFLSASSKSFLSISSIYVDISSFCPYRPNHPRRFCPHCPHLSRRFCPYIAFVCIVGDLCDLCDFSVLCIVLTVTCPPRDVRRDEIEKGHLILRENQTNDIYVWNMFRNQNRPDIYLRTTIEMHFEWLIFSKEARKMWEGDPDCCCDGSGRKHSGWTGVCNISGFSYLKSGFTVLRLLSFYRGTICHTRIFVNRDRALIFCRS